MIFAFRNRIDIWLGERANVPYWVEDIVISYCILRELKFGIAYHTSWNDLEDVSRLSKESLSWHSDNKGTRGVFMSDCHTVFLISVWASRELLKESLFFKLLKESLFFLFQVGKSFILLFIGEAFFLLVVCQRFDVKYSHCEEYLKSSPTSWYWINRQKKKKKKVPKIPSLTLLWYWTNKSFYSVCFHSIKKHGV